MKSHVVAYVSPDSAKSLQNAEAKGILRRVGSLSEFANAIIDEPAPCVVLELPSSGNREKDFLGSLVATFPLVEGAVISNQGKEGIEAGPLEFSNRMSSIRSGFKPAWANVHRRTGGSITASSGRSTLSSPMTGPRTSIVFAPLAPAGPTSNQCGRDRKPRHRQPLRFAFRTSS